MTQIIQLSTATGEVHGLLEQLPNSVSFDDFAKADVKNREKLKKELAHRKKMVKGRYINRQGSNERLEKSYCAGSGEPIQLWKLIPDYVYELPMGFIEEVNASSIPIRSELLSVDGKSINSDDTPLKKDGVERIHEIVPIGF